MCSYVRTCTQQNDAIAIMLSNYLIDSDGEGRGGKGREGKGREGKGGGLLNVGRSTGGEMS